MEEKNREKEETPLLIHSAKELAEMDIKQEWIVDGLIPARSVVNISATAGGGKTFFGLRIAQAISEGQTLFTNASARYFTQKKSVLYIDAENSEVELKRRLKMLGCAAENIYFAHDNSFYFDATKEDNPEAFDNMAKLNAFLINHKIEVIIIDTLRSTFLGNENSSQDISKLMQKAFGLVRLGCTVIFLHHFGKIDRDATTDQNIYRGSKAIVDLAAATYTLSEVSTTENNDSSAQEEIQNILVECHKMRVAKKPKPFEMKYTFSRDSAGDNTLKIEYVGDSYKISESRATACAYAINIWLEKNKKVNDETRYTEIYEGIGGEKSFSKKTFGSALKMEFENSKPSLKKKDSTNKKSPYIVLRVPQRSGL